MIPRNLNITRLRHGGKHSPVAPFSARRANHLSSASSCPPTSPCGADYTTEIKPLDEKSTASSTDAGRVAGRASRPDGGIGWVAGELWLGPATSPAFAWTKMNWIRRRNGGEFWTMSSSVRSQVRGLATWGTKNFQSRGQPYRRTDKDRQKRSQGKHTVRWPPTFLRLMMAREAGLIMPDSGE